MANIPLSDGSVPPQHLWQKWVMTDYIPASNQPIHGDRYEMRIGWVWQAFGRCLSQVIQIFEDIPDLAGCGLAGNYLRRQNAADESPPSGAAERVPSCGLYSCSSSQWEHKKHPFARDCMFTFVPPVPQKSLNYIGSLTMNLCILRCESTMFMREENSWRK